MGDVVLTEQIVCGFDMETNADQCVASDLHVPHRATHVFENIERYSIDRLSVLLNEHGGVSIRNNDYNNFEVKFVCEKVRPKRDEITGEIRYALQCRAREK